MRESYLSATVGDSKLLVYFVNGELSIEVDEQTAKPGVNSNHARVKLDSDTRRMLTKFLLETT